MSHTAGTVKESVTSLDGVVDSVGTGGVVDLPETETNERHLRARSAECHGDQQEHGQLATHLAAVVKLDSWSNHFGCCVESD